MFAAVVEAVVVVVVVMCMRLRMWPSSWYAALLMTIVLPETLTLELFGYPLILMKIGADSIMSVASVMMGARAAIAAVKVAKSVTVVDTQVAAPTNDARPVSHVVQFVAPGTAAYVIDGHVTHPWPCWKRPASHSMHTPGLGPALYFPAEQRSQADPSLGVVSRGQFSSHTSAPEAEKFPAGQAVHDRLPEEAEN